MSDTCQTLVFVITELGPSDDPGFLIQGVPVVDGGSNDGHVWGEFWDSRPDEATHCDSCPFASCTDCKYQPDHEERK